MGPAAGPPRCSGKCAPRLPAEIAESRLEPATSFLHEEEGRVSATAAELEPALADRLRRGGVLGDVPGVLLHLRDDSGILCGESSDRYRFLHLGFQEYFTARGWREVLLLLFVRPRTAPRGRTRKAPVRVRGVSQDGLDRRPVALRADPVARELR